MKKNLKKLGRKSYFMMTVLSALMLGNVGCGQQNTASNDSVLQNAKQEVKNAEIVFEEDFDKAMAKAKKEGKILMLEFTGSQWCPPCKMMKKFVVDTEKFAKYAKEKLVNVVADFDYSGNPTNATQSNNYQNLLQKFKVGGFPTVVFIDPSTGKTDSIVGLAFDTPDGLITYIEKFKAQNSK